MAKPKRPPASGYDVSAYGHAIDIDPTGALVVATVDGSKLYSGELSHRAANWALQIHGGYGFMDEYAISRLYRDQKILEIGEGTNEIQRMVIARHLGL